MKEMFLGKTLAAVMLTAAGTMSVSAAGFEILRINPEDGAEVDEISLVEWWSNNDDYVTDWSMGVELYDAGGNRVGYASDTSFDWDDYTYLSVTFSPAVKTAGDYTLVFPAGLFKDGNENVLNTEDITYTYHVTGNAGGGEEPGPGDPVTGGSMTYLGVVPAQGTVDYNMGTVLSTLNIIFDEELEIVDPAASLTLVGEDGKMYESEGTQAFNFKKYGDKNMLIVRFGDNAPVYSGTYTLELPAGFIRMSGGDATNEAMTFSWDYIQDKNLVVGDIQPDETPLDLTTLTVTDKATGELIYDLLDPSTVVTYLPYGDAVLNIGFERDEVFGMEYAVHNITKDEYVARVWTYEDGEGIYTNGVRGEDGLFHFNMSRSTELEDQFEYEIEIHAFYKAEPIDQRIPKGSASVPLKAGGKSVIYNRDIEVLDITPEVNGTMSAENNVFTITFSEPVQVVTEKVTSNGQSSYVTGTLEAYAGLTPFMAVVPNVDKTVWSFTVDPSFLMGMEGSFVAQVAVNDMEGRRVVPSDENCSLFGFGASEAGVLSRLDLSFCAYDGCRDIVVEPGAGVLESIYSFTFTCPDAPGRNIAVQYVDAKGNQPVGVLRAANGARVATLMSDPSEVDVTYDQDPDDPNSRDVMSIALTMHLDREVTAPGRYYLELPGGYFMTGTEYGAIPGKPVNLEYVIEGDVAIDNTSLVDGDNVSLLSMVSLYIGGEATVAEDAKMSLFRSGDRRRVVAEAPLRVTTEGAYSRVYADFCDSETGFASLRLDPRDDANEGRGQNYDLVVEKGAVSTADGMEFSEKVITIHTPGAAESGSVETATFTAQFPYHQATIANVINGEPVRMMLMPGEGWKLDTVLYNGQDITETVTDNMLVTPAVQGEGQVDVLFTFDGDIQFLEATGILDINDSDYRAFIENGEVVIEGLTGGEFVQVYNLGGALITMYEPQSGKDTLRISLPAGTFVITIDGRHAIKVNI